MYNHETRVKEVQQAYHSNKVDQTLTEFSELRDILERYSYTSTGNSEELDRLTVELLKVVELKKIASILAEKE